MDKNSLVRQIEEAFDSGPLPPPGNIVSHHCPECERVANTFRGRHWKEWKNIPLDYFNALNLDFRSLLTDEAQLFYLPLFMISCIHDHKAADVFCDSLIGSFIPPADKLSLEAQETAEQIIREGIPGVPEDQMAEVRQAVSDSLDPRPGHAQESRNAYLAMIGGLSKLQLQAIHAFLIFLKNERGDDSAASLERAIAAISAPEREE